MAESKNLAQLWKDYVEKGNSFANWFTSILISNFVYLVKLGEGRKLECAGKWSLGLSVLSLVAMFFFRAAGVWTAQRRHDLESEGIDSDHDNSLKIVETSRKWVFYLFGVVGMIAASISAFILWGHLTEQAK